MNEKMLRRDFTTRSILALLGGVAVTIAGCSDSDGPASPTPQAPLGGGPAPTDARDVSGTVSANHGHAAVVTGAQLTAGNAIVLDITGGANHPHRVELSAGEIGQIASGQRVSKVSSADFSHDHTVTFN
jgi:hypothetical protein